MVAVATATIIGTPAQSQTPVELVRLVDNPTAGLVDKGRFAADLRLFPEGGLQGQLTAGIMRRLSIGLSFGGEGIIGDGAVNWYPRVEVAARYRLIEENASLPAFTLGYETRGYGRYVGERYQVKSKGFFLALSKNYVSGFGQFGVHAGANRSREDEDDGGLTGWVGLDKTVNEELIVAGEYDFALDDNADDSLGSGRGYLNLGAFWSPTEGLHLGFLLKNVLENADGDGIGPDPDMSRELVVRYTESF
jgi:hypothetical protein